MAVLTVADVRLALKGKTAPVKTEPDKPSSAGAGGKTSTPAPAKQKGKAAPKAGKKAG